MWLFALPLRDRGKIGIAIDGLFAHVLPAIEQEYGKGNSNQSAQEGAKRPIACLVVHHRLRSFGRQPNACAGCRFLRREPLEIAATLWRLAGAARCGCASRSAALMQSKLIKGASGDWEVVIGMEVHAQVTSQSKLFSGASTAFGGEPNSHVSLVDAAMPGMLPVINEVCVEQAIRTGLGLKAHINLRSSFDRKNYFYPDLP